ncbi:RNA 2',3'-cyclic phosphodiesterase [Salinimonas sediminis]|nr:RNA 2',3'-cyclic phosphodiesterase [Salinimonas sediminis]
MKMRCFIGLDLSVSNKLALEQWRNKALPDLPSRTPAPAKGSRHKVSSAAPPAAVAPANFHLTLAFLGQLDMRQHEEVMARLDEVRQPPISLTLDTTGVWQGPKILFCAPHNVPDELYELVRQVTKAARQSGIAIERREYRPHVTMLRKASAALPPPLYPPQIACNFDKFHLFESVSSPHGVSYPIRHSWPLIPNLSVRERLRRGLA